MSSGRMLSSISSWLKTKHILVPDDWIAECLEWISSENQNVRDEVIVRKMVYEQWLLTDLRDFGVGVLPEGVKDDVFVLQGLFCVQIDSIQDVSQPKYSQLLQRQNKESGNTSISAETQPTQKPWEVKPTRMLMLKITDGVNEISAMEYYTISQLTDKLPPGTKLRIKGPVKCRRGVLMLKQGNTEVLGGEVEDLFAANNYEAILYQGLGKTPPAPTNRITSHQNNHDQLQAAHSAGGLASTSIANEDLHDILLDADFDDDFEVKDLSTEPVVMETGVESTPLSSEKPSVITISDDESLIGILDDADNDEDELIAMADLSSLCDGTDTIKSEPPVKPTSSLPISGAKCINFSAQNSGFSNVNRESREDRHIQKSESVSQNYNLQSGLQTSVVRKETIPRSSNLSKSIQKPCFRGSDEFKVPKNFRDPKSTTITSYSAIKTEPNSNKGATGQLMTAASYGSDPSLSDMKHACLESDKMPSTSHTTAVTSEREKRLFLCLAKKSLLTNATEKTLNIRVKAIVVTLLSKLNFDILSGWSLKARICDGTDMLDVEFGNNVLQKLIGFSAADKEALMQSQNSIEKQRLVSGLKSCRETIISMCHFMGIEIRKLDNNHLMGFVTELEL